MSHTTKHCQSVKVGSVAKEDFADFLHHVEGCKDCQRRIKSQFIIQFKQKIKEI